MEEQMTELVKFMHENAADISPRDFAEGMEILHQYGELLDELIETGLPKTDPNVYVKVEGVTIRFKNTDDLARWIQEAMYR